ncbi:hypothetical protein N781_09295 [Pontibacillus halophilus JSM 076056 = DSM 19796]|uniref:DUF58 domain-containing protein n=1 Tax=Pontibacillus halophilus JSM 076056 = DSM 19796 TaxID=1385510 RepID=A0A0A5G820_9BACI|nr:hypothetical protein N781_09295 [Pontibacillus halophilus JSM 076056 = DSM 19796]
MFRTVTILLLVTILFSYAMFQGGFVSWFLFYATLPLFLYMLGVVVYPMSKWHVERTFSKAVAQEGETITVDVHVKRKLPFPLFYCIVEEETPNSLRMSGRLRDKYKDMNASLKGRQEPPLKTILFPWFHTSFTFTYVFEEVSRGEHHFHNIRLRTGDIFGFVKKETTCDLHGSILVYPSQRDVHMQPSLSSYEEGSLQSKGTMKRDTSIVTGVREYVPGDRFSWVDWKTTAKQGTVMTKEFEQEKSANSLLIMDGTMDDHTDDLSYEGVVEFCASFLTSYGNSEADLTFVMIGQGVHYINEANRRGKNKALYQLAKVQPEKGDSFGEKLQKEQATLPINHVCYVVIKQLDEHVQQSIEWLKKRNSKVVLFLVMSEMKRDEEMEERLNQLSIKGIVANVMTENEMSHSAFEVKT